MKCPKIVCGWCSAPDPAGGACDAPYPLVGWGGEHSLPIPFPLTPLTAVVERLL